MTFWLVKMVRLAMRKIKERIIRKLINIPVSARHAEYSMLFSLDDDVSQPSERLISASLEAIGNARKVDLSDISARMKNPPYWPNLWPGEHYKLLAGFTMALRPKLVLEIGTGTGLSTLSMKKYLSHEAKMVTFDIIGWRSYPDSCLCEDDFRDARLVQYTDDLSQPSNIGNYIHLLEHADMFFIDAAKDGIMEQRLLDNFKAMQFTKAPLMIFDDVRIWNMLKIWRHIAFPKIDLTSFGHWTGTGVLEWRLPQQQR